MDQNPGQIIGPQPQYPPPLPQNPMPNSMMDMGEDEEEKSWFAGLWGALILMVATGPPIGLLLWWSWFRSPLRFWVKLLLTLILLGAVIVFVANPDLISDLTGS